MAFHLINSFVNPTFGLTLNQASAKRKIWCVVKDSLAPQINSSSASEVAALELCRACTNSYRLIALPVGRLMVIHTDAFALLVKDYETEQVSVYWWPKYRIIEQELWRRADLRTSFAHWINLGKDINHPPLFLTLCFPQCSSINSCCCPYFVSS